MIAAMEDSSMEKIVALCKRRGFVYQGSEIYGGLGGTWDYGPLGIALKHNIEHLWWKMFVDSRDDMYGIDSSILMSARVWEVSGHVGNFADPLVEDKKTRKRYRADQLLEERGVDPTGMTLVQIGDAIAKYRITSPEGNELALPRQFNMMFKTSIGSVEGEESALYLRPETAQGMFVNFKNIVDSFHPKLPFGIAQIGKSFRNEIAPRDFLFRVRELEIMELEYFIVEKEWKEKFDYWRAECHRWFAGLGFSSDDIQENEIPENDRAHYSKRTVDFYFKYPFGYKEIAGLAYRTDYDLKRHTQESGEHLLYSNPTTGEKFIPHVLEPTFGLGRHILAVLAKAYDEDDLGGEKRIVLRLPFHLAPIKVAVFPLLKNKPELVEKAQKIYESLKGSMLHVSWDDNGNIGKRYRRQDEIGTPLCVTVDFDTLEEDTVTVRDRDTGKQERVLTSKLLAFLNNRITV